MNAAGAEDQGVGGTGQTHALAGAGSQLGRLQLEGHGDVAALATGGGEVLHKGGKAVERDQCALIAQLLACQFGKAGVNPGGAAMGNGVACNAVRVGDGGHESRGCRSSRW